MIFALCRSSRIFRLFIKKWIKLFSNFLSFFLYYFVIVCYTIKNKQIIRFCMSLYNIKSIYQVIK